ncbi:MAG: hypothetical protein V1776_00455 [Candidatus Diapherotrites archaeon]
MTNEIQQQLTKKISKERELELVALKIKQQVAEMKAKGLKYETWEEVKKRYGFTE